MTVPGAQDGSRSDSTLSRHIARRGTSFRFRARCGRRAPGKRKTARIAENSQLAGRFHAELIRSGGAHQRLWQAGHLGRSA